MAVGRWLESAAWAVEEGRAAAEEAAAGRRSALKRACALDELSLKDLALLLSLPSDLKLDEELATAGFRCRELQFGRRVGLFAPLCFWSVRAQDRLHGGFRGSLGPPGCRVVDREEISAEAEALFAQGHRRVLLIAIEGPAPRDMAPAASTVESVCAAGSGAEPAAEPVRAAEPAAELMRAAEAAVESVRAAAAAVEAVRAGGQVVGAAVAPGEWSSDNAGVFLAAELGPLSTREFARLARHGVSAQILFQGTYDAELYRGLYPFGSTTDFANRLEAPERATAGGVSQLGLGAFFGLGDPVFETVALVAHARHLEMLFGRPLASVSAPRLEPAPGAPLSPTPPHPVPNALWLRVLALLRLALPLTDLIVSSREMVLMRRESLRRGATVLSVGPNTGPGGDAPADPNRAAYLAGDDRPLSHVSADLRAMGFEPSPEVGEGT